MRLHLILGMAACAASFAQAAEVTATYTGLAPVITYVGDDGVATPDDPGKALALTVHFQDGMAFNRNAWNWAYVGWNLEFGTVDQVYSTQGSKYSTLRFYIDDQGYITQWDLWATISNYSFSSVYIANGKQEDTLWGYTNPPDNWAYVFNFTSTNGPGAWSQSGALALTPVPEPTAWALALSGLIAAGLSRSKRRASALPGQSLARPTRHEASGL